MSSKADPQTPASTEAIEEPRDSLPEVTLESLPGPLQDAAARAGWDSLMPVQAKGIPYLLAGKDVMDRYQERWQDDPSNADNTNSCLHGCSDCGV